MERSFVAEDRITFDILEHIGIIEEQENGWRREVNIVAWNGGPPKVDIRSWDPSHTRMTRGITLREDESRKLVDMLRGYYARKEERSRSAASRGDLER